MQSIPIATSTRLNDSSPKLEPFRFSPSSIVPSDLTGKSNIIPEPVQIEGEYCDITVLNKRTEKDLTPDVASVIRLVTDRIETLPVGTFKYKVFKYPSDIDIFERLEGCCTFNFAKVRAAAAIQNIIRDINSDSSVIFSDFKAGYDHRFKIYTGVIGDTIADYNAVFIRRDISNLYEAGLLTALEYQDLISLAKDIPTLNDVITLNEKLRSFWVIRWTIPELLAGNKILPGNYKLFLDVALTQGSVVKLDTIAKIDGDDSRYIEVTNFFLVTQKDKFGNTIVLSEELGDYAQSLLEDVYKYYDNNVLKSIKRLWMYLAFKGRICDLGLFTPLFDSDIALHAQIVGDLDLAINLLGSNFSYDKRFLYDSLNRRLAKLNGICVRQPIYTSPNSSDPNIIRNNLMKLRECLMESVNDRTRKWLTARNIDILALAQS